MKILFLDIDGVLNSEAFFLAKDKRLGGPKRIIVVENLPETHLDEKAIERLNEIVEKTQCHIVISSTWRLTVGVQKIKNFFINKGFKFSDRIIDATPDIPKAMRGFEIGAWLATSAPEPIDAFIIVDDDNDMGTLAPHLVQTTWKEGLTDALAQKIIKKLCAL